MRTRMLFLVALVAATFPALAADRIRIVNEGGIRDQWTLAPGMQLPMPGYPASYAGKPEQVCVAVGYLLNADGHTSDLALLKSWSSGGEPSSNAKFWGAFAGAASQALSQWQFMPKPGVDSPKPVYTVATFVFGPAGATATQENCAIPDLTTRMVELRYNGRAGRMMARGIYSRLDIDPNVEERLRQRTLVEREEHVQADQNRTIQEQRQPPPSSNK